MRTYTGDCDDNDNNNSLTIYCYSRVLHQYSDLRVLRFHENINYTILLRTIVNHPKYVNEFKIVFNSARFKKWFKLLKCTPF